MLSYVIHNKSMNSPFTGEWFPSRHPANPRLKVSSVQIFWSGITGAVSGTVQLFVTNDVKVESLLDTVFIENTDNTADAEMIRLEPVFSHFRLKYSPVGITGGRLSAVVYYSYS